MIQPREFGTFELAPNDNLWVQPTSIYGLLNLLFDPVGWVAQRMVNGRPAVLLSPYVITFEPHASDHGIPANQILVQGIDGTGLITIHAGPMTGAQLLDHVHAAPHYQAFAQAALAGADATATGTDDHHTTQFKSALLPAMFRVLHRQDLDQPVTPTPDSATLFQKYKSSHMGKQLDASVVHSSGQGRDFVYVHFPIWPHDGSLGASPSKLSMQERIAEKQAEVALFHYSSVSDPNFLIDVLNGAKLRGAASSYQWNNSGKFTLNPGGSAPGQLKFTQPSGGLRIVHIGKERPTDPTSPQPRSLSAPADTTPQNACEILIGAPQPNGSVLLHEAYCKPYE